MPVRIPPFGPVTLAAASLVLVVLSPALASPARVPGTQVVLEPPPGFVLAEGFPGFLRADAGASIMVTELPDPLETLRASMTARDLAASGMTLMRSQATSVAGREALLLWAKQEAAGTRLHKWMLIFGDSSRSVLVVAAFPKARAAELEEPLIRTLLAAGWSTDAPRDPFEGLSFRLAETAGLKVGERMSNLLTLTEPGATGPFAPPAPMLVVSAAAGDAVIQDLEGFSRERVARTARIGELANLHGRHLAVDGLLAYELVADTRDLESGSPLRLYQVVVAEDESYLLMQGFVGETRAQEFLPQFRQVASSLRWQR